MDGSRTHHGSQRDPTTDFEDREAHRDLTIPTVKHNQQPPGCQRVTEYYFFLAFFAATLSAFCAAR
jgi:hypothetical protein